MPPKHQPGYVSRPVKSLDVPGSKAFAKVESLGFIWISDLLLVWYFGDTFESEFLDLAEKPSAVVVFEDEKARQKAAAKTS